MQKPLVINLFGAPGVGKSTGAAKVFTELKQLGVNCELVGEVAKDITWEHNMTALACQEYVFGKQSYRLARCRNDVDVIITDSPLPLTIIYNSNEAIKNSLPELVLDIFNTYNNVNFFLNRVKPYNPKGRNQSEEESDAISDEVLMLLYEYGIDCEHVNGDSEGYQYIVDQVCKLLNKDKEE